MSIASNVVLENTRLGDIRTKIENKLTEYNIWWDNIFYNASRPGGFIDKTTGGDRDRKSVV